MTQKFLIKKTTSEAGVDGEGQASTVIFWEKIIVLFWFLRHSQRKGVAILKNKQSRNLDW